MASVISDPNGRKRIQFVASDGSRRTLRLGKATVKQADTVRTHAEHIVTAKLTRTPVPQETALWLADLDDVMMDKLAAVGLVPPRASKALGAFLDAYIAERVDVKPATAIVYGHTRRCLIGHFGADKAMRDITLGDADAWRLSLIAQDLADNTVRRRCGIAKQFFHAAVRRKLIPTNPFSDLKAAVQANKAREFFITRDMATKVLDACPNAEWRLLFALSRYGGLRCPSEHLALMWEDVDWERGRITVHSPKNGASSGRGIADHADLPGIAAIPAGGV